MRIASPEPCSGFSEAHRELVVVSIVVRSVVVVVDVGVDRLSEVIEGRGV